MLEETCDDNLGIEIQRRKDSITNRNLLISAWEGNIDEIRNCIGQGADIKFVDRGGNTPLHYAIQSKNVDVVKYFVENLEDINVENNECKTSLDIAIAMKQNDIIDMLYEKNVAKADEIFQNDINHDDIVNEGSFMEHTFQNNYYGTLSAEDSQNILDFKYFRRNAEKVLKSIEITLEENKTKEVIENEIKKFTENKKTTTLILSQNRQVRSTLVFCYTNEDQFKAYYTNVYDLPTYIIDLIRSKGIEIRYIELDRTHMTGISELKFVELFDPFLDEDEVKKKLEGLNEEKEREFYANILMEKKRVEDKIDVCFEILRNLNKNKSDVEKLNHKNANVFINFLEAFALQDTFPKLSPNIWTQEEIDEKTKTLIKLKKDYFTTYYYYDPERKRKSDYEHIDSARQMILHSRKIMQPQDFDCFMKDKSSVCIFFKILEKYIEKIKNKIENKLIQIDGETHCYEFLTYEPNIESLEDGKLCDIRNFLLEIYKPEDKIKQDETIFNLTVNIFPIIAKKKEKFKSLSMTRNNLVHNYQEKSKLNNEKKFKEIKELHILRSELFKYFYAEEVHGLLSKILDKDIETLQDDFQKILDDFQKENIRISGEHSNSFEHGFQEPLFPERDEIIDLVDKYLKYAFIVEKKSGAEEVECTELTVDVKRDLLEDFMKLKKSQETTSAECQNERENLKKKLNVYGLDENGFDRVVRYYLDDSNVLPRNSIKKRDKIIEIISSLKQIEEEHSLSNSTIINLYEKYLELKKKGFIIRENHHSDLDEILDKSKLKKSQKNDILRRLCNLPGVETIDVMIGEEKFVELNTFDIIRNIFVFCSLYHKYKIKFYNVEEAFNDETFLDYLTSFNITVNVTVEKEKISKSLKDTLKEKKEMYLEMYLEIKRYFVSVWIKKLLTTDFASPYIAKLLYDSNDDAVIDKKDFINLLGTLLKKNAYVKHLAKLLNFESKKFDVYGEFCDQILDNKFNIENIRDILQDHNHAKSILSKLNTKVENIKKNYLLEDEATKIEEFCKKILNKHFSIKYSHNILQDCVEVRVILCKLIANIENVKIEHSFKKKLKKVREFLEKILTDTNVQKEFQNNCIKEIVCNLNDKIHSRSINYGKEKSIKAIENVTQQILKQLNIITYELHYDSCYEDVVKILDTSIVASKKLMQNDDLKRILLDAEFQKARSMIQLAAIKINKAPNIQKHTKPIRRALRILHRIEDKQDRNPKFLLISAEIAYAERLLQKYGKSYQSYETLFKKIALNNEFSKLENSKEYQKMLTISDEAKKYLSITNIQTSMALNKRSIGWELKLKGRDEKALNNLKEALKILEKLYSFRKKSLINNLDTEKRIELAHIAFEIANAKLKIGKLYDEKNAAQEALVKCIQCSESLKDIYSSFHPTYKKCIYLIEVILNFSEGNNKYSRMRFEAFCRRHGGCKIL